MTTAQYRTALAAARRELEQLTTQRSDLDTRIAQLRQTIATLAQLCDEPADLDLGLTDACRNVIRGAVALRAPDIRDRVAALGVDLSQYSNAIGAIHTVLNRLVEAGEVHSFLGYDKKRVFSWRYPVRTIVLDAGAEPAEREKPGSKRKSASRGDRDHERR